jgi:hypothetical protein
MTRRSGHAHHVPEPGSQGRHSVQLITAAEAAGHARVAEMNKQVAANLDKIITALEADGDERRQPPMRPDPGHPADRRRSPPARADPCQGDPGSVRARPDRHARYVRLRRCGSPGNLPILALYPARIRHQIQRLRTSTSRAPSASVPAGQQSTDA